MHQAFEINFAESEPNIINFQSNFFVGKKIFKTVFNGHYNKPEVLPVMLEVFEV